MVVGLDEVGRGSLAGPLVAGAAYLIEKNGLKSILKLGIDDSKRLSAQSRAELVLPIKKYFKTSVGESSVGEINRLGIVRATRLAMKRALSGILSGKNSAYFFLIDGLPLKNFPGGQKRQLAVISGDQKSVSIAAASIVAKVHRDRLMRRLDREFPAYFWGRNKGYGTRLHLERIQAKGICLHHRLQFVD